MSETNSNCYWFTFFPVTFSINAMQELIEQQTEQLKTLNEKYLDLSSQVDSHVQLQADVDKQK